MVRRTVPVDGAAGDDLHGEARLVDAMVPRGSRVLDAGAGRAGVVVTSLERVTKSSVSTSIRC